MVSAVTDPFTRSRITTNGVALSTSTTGTGAAIVLLHGWPHTWELWRPFGQVLAAHGCHVIAPDMRGVGESERPDTGYDVATLTDDIVGLLDALQIPSATVVGIDAGVATAFFAALTVPERFDRLVVMEGLLPGLPGADEFLAAGPPWWFGFHSVPGLAETVLEGRETDYLNWFLTGPSVRNDIGADARSAFIAAYTGRDALRAGFEYYRTGRANAELLAGALDKHRLGVPTLAISGGIVGDALAHQIAPVADDLTTTSIENCGHLIPLEKPMELLTAVRKWWLSASIRPCRPHQNPPRSGSVSASASRC